jgi:hypothetical protein
MKTKKEMIVKIAKSVREDDLSEYSGEYSKVSDFFTSYNDLVSPIAKEANNANAKVMVVMQDWMHIDVALDLPSDYEHGFSPKFKSNKILDENLERYLGINRGDTYMTNGFVHIKHTETVDGTVNGKDMRKSIEKFNMPLINALSDTVKVVLVFGSNVSFQFKKIISADKDVAYADHEGIRYFFMHHPSARVSNEKKDLQWQEVTDYMNVV